MAGRVEIAAQLLAHGADVNGRAPEFGETPLHYAASYGQRAMIEFLVRSGADLNAGDYNGVRPVQYARIRRQGLAVDLLMRVGARPDNLHDAVNAGDVAHVQFPCPPIGARRQPTITSPRMPEMKTHA
jgi:ankyrin repeat protein